MTATIRRVPRPRGELEAGEIRRAEKLRDQADGAQAEYRDYVVGLLAKGRSFAEVAKATWLCTNTLQRWKKEAAG